MSSTSVKPLEAAVPVETQAGEQVNIQHRDLGICTTCRHQSRCLFFSAARNAIWQCEEFDDSSAAGPGAKPPQ